VKGSTSIRFRTTLLFCAAAGVLLLGSFVAVHVLFSSAVYAELDRKLVETAGPIIADQIADPDEKDVDLLNLPDSYFEVLDSNGQVSQRSRNLADDLALDNIPKPGDLPVFQTISFYGAGELRAALVPFRAGGRDFALVVAGPTRDVRAALATFRWYTLLLLTVSLVIMAVVSAFYARKLDLVVGELRQFVSDASHELKTPLAVLRGETELLLQRPRTVVEYEQALKIIDGELKTLGKIVEGLFTLSMADAGQLRLASGDVCLDDVLEESIALASPLARARGIRIDRDLAEGVVVRGDAAFLRQLFLIFVDNALKYSARGTTLAVCLRADADVIVTFKDQGIGISARDLPNIFKRFFRAAPQEDPEPQSGGLGLAIAKAIVRAHDGSIACTSEPGVGSLFTVRLPLLRLTSAPAELQIPAP